MRVSHEGDPAVEEFEMAFNTQAGVIKIITYVSVIKDHKLLMVEHGAPSTTTLSGWGIPAPELEFGEHPEDQVNKVLDTLGLSGETTRLDEVESFETSAGWNMIFHYVINTSKDLPLASPYKQVRWFALEDLPPVEQIAHGKWERGVAAARLRSTAPRLQM